ncbi:hypothetical protein TNCV_1850331 [Trichonephila clavipes]|nr:hypothetical protein TNCV_1850331 [Trichonephila clavipes]
MPPNKHRPTYTEYVLVKSVGPVGNRSRVQETISLPSSPYLNWGGGDSSPVRRTGIPASSSIILNSWSWYEGHYLVDGSVQLLVRILMTLGTRCVEELVPVK